LSRAGIPIAYKRRKTRRARSDAFAYALTLSYRDIKPKNTKNYEQK
jgi:hypothetical protein